MDKSNKGPQDGESKKSETPEKPDYYQSNYVCPVTEAEFLEHAGPLVLEVGGTKILIQPRPFGTGSFGFGGQDRIIVEINGKPCKVMCTINFPLVKSNKAARK